MRSFVVMFAAAMGVIVLGATAGAQSFNPGGAAGEAATIVQGKTMSAYGDNAVGGTPIPAFPATVTIASLPAPSKYKSKNLLLAVQTSAQVNCVGDSTATVASITGFGGSPIFLQPDPGQAFFIDCSNAGDTSVARTFWQPREADGGPFIDNKTAPGATINVLMASGAGTAGFSAPSVVAQTFK